MAKRVSSRDGQRSSKEFWKVFGPATLVTLAGFVLAYQFVEPAPPRHFTIATGQEEGAYFGFAEHYRDVLVREGITLEVRATSGSMENIGLLEAGDGTVEAAFVQGGTDRETEAEHLLALASLYFEPLWIFTSMSPPPDRLSALAGRRVAVGGEGSGTRAVTLQLLADNDVTEESAELLPLGGMAAAEALLEGEVEGAFFVASPRSSVVRKLLEAGSVELTSLARAEAYTRKYHYLSRVTLPEGLIDFRRNKPARDVAMLAPTANLVVSDELHPALIVLLLQAAAEVHGEGGLFERPGEFPSALHLDLPLSDTARRYFEAGPPFLQRYLPFWAADLIDRLKIMLLPLLTLMIPLFRIVPPAYRWRVRSRIFRWYAELQAIDDQLGTLGTVEEVGRALAELDRIESEVMRVSVPLSYADSLYHLRLHIDLVRSKVTQARTESEGQSAQAPDSL